MDASLLRHGPGCQVHLDFISLESFKDFIYLFGREGKRVQAGGAAEGEEEAGSPLSSEPHKGLDPRTLESRSELKADT